MAAASWLRYAYLAHVSRPKSVRKIYRLAKRKRICRIVDVGISDVRRAAALIEVAQRYAGQTIAYTGIDWFDSRGEELESLSLKQAYRLLRPTGAHVRLVPGEPGASLVAVANAHQNTDLIVIAHSVADGELAPAWFYLPRMLHAESTILRERREGEGQFSFSPLTAAQVSVWGTRDPRRRAA